MIDRAMIFGLVASIGVLLFILELVRQRKLREDYSLLWLVTGFVLIVLSLSRPLLDTIAAMLGVVTYPPAALFLVAIIFMLFILLHYSTALTQLSQENKSMAQQMAILRWEVSQMQRENASDQTARPDDDHHQQDGDI